MVSESKPEEVDPTTVNPTTTQEVSSKSENKDVQADQEVVTTVSSTIVEEPSTHKYKRTPVDITEAPKDVSSTKEPSVLAEIQNILRTETHSHEASSTTAEPSTTTQKKEEEGGIFGLFKEPLNALSGLLGLGSTSTTTTTEKAIVDEKKETTTSAPSSSEKPAADEPSTAKAIDTSTKSESSDKKENSSESPKVNDEKHESTTDGSTYVNFTVTLNNEQYNVARTTEKDSTETTTEQDESTTTDVTTISSDASEASTEQTVTFVGTTEFVNFTVSIKKSDEHMDKVVRRSIQLPHAFNRRRRDTETSGCMFDGKNLKVSEKVQVESKCLECVCELPPLAHCIKKENCHES